ncbi:NmrA family protein [Macrolepiota fuliginosa MF-IS2]|uniref:NmrA family protein n=1 Tax=Macrolepiota fuliginosa MF-IS2 TaxID=1400762 RepID=A0A9P5XPD4_9AGAR|nr:NmrA family protein [Macrolepiota fuliginosa MF-IS2]
MSRLIVVTGATGQQGGSVVDFLLKEPAGAFRVRGMTRNPESSAALALIARGVEIVKADLSSLEETTKAFQGAWGIYGVTQFYEHGYDVEQLHGKNIVEASRQVGAKHIVWSTVEGHEGECGAISWTSKVVIEDLIIKSGIPYTFVHIPMYYENFWTSFFAPKYNEEKGFHWSVGFLPDVPIFAYSVTDHGAWVIPAFREPEIYNGKRIKIVVEYLSLRDFANQFSEVTGEKASLALELTREQFEASRYADHPAAELMYLSWEYVIRAGPDSGVRDKEQSLSIYPQAKTYKEWLKDSELVKNLVAKLKAEAAAEAVNS